MTCHFNSVFPSLPSLVPAPPFFARHLDLQMKLVGTVILIFTFVLQVWDIY